MPFDTTTFRVAIASPGDVNEERRVIRSVVHDWNAAHARTRAVVLLPVGWESDSAALMGARAQEIINNQVIRTADLLIAVFWTRLGTPTSVAPSGTVEEIQEFLAAGKPVMIYFSNAPVVPASIDQKQYAALLEFKTWCEANGLVGSYTSVVELRERLTRELALLVNTHSNFLTAAPLPAELGGDTFRASGSVSPDPLTELSPEALNVLSEAAKDPNGAVLMVEYLAGMAVQTNGLSLVPEGDHRISAAYRDAVETLVELEYLREVGSKGEVFEVTHTGYQAADRLATRGAGGA
ncbi:MAG: DUF4062 domain-containing protein [Rubrivivax sp.]|nr:DUF4062 domain-containing protein [Rubrivivax sp.]MCL4696613.1 hypothetical protein [Burkholderiaceae bacterium]